MMTKPDIKAITGSLLMVSIFTIVWSVFMPLLGFGISLFSIAGGVVFSAYGIWLIFRASKIMRKVNALPDVPLSEADILETKRIGRKYNIYFGIEIFLMFASGMIFGSSLIGTPDYCCPVIALIVGVHFFQLSKLLRMKIHTILGIPIVLVSIISIIVISTTQWIRPMVGICCLTMAVCTAIMATYLLRYVKALLRQNEDKLMGEN